MSFTGPGVRQDLYDVTATFVGTDGSKVSFVFDTFKGGAATAKETKYRPANGTEDEVTLGGSVSIGNITLGRLYQSDIDGWVHWLLNQCGKANVTVSKQPLDQNGKNFGTPLNYKGVLNAVTPPDTDSDKGDAASMIEVEVSTVAPIS